MNKVLNLVAVAGLTLVAAASAHAQVPKALGTFDIKAGVFQAPNSNAKDSQGQTVLSLGADYAPPNLPITGSQHPNVYADYAGGTKNGGHCNFAGIGLSTKYEPPLVGQITKITPYGGIGVGAYRISVTNANTGEHSVNTTVGGKVYAGVQFSNYLLEVNYTLLPSEKGVNPSGVGIQLGMNL